MKRFLKITLISLASLIGLIALIALGGWLYLKATFLNFEKGYEPKTDIETVTEGGYSFLDRNGDGSLDVYEDDRNPAEVRVADILSKMTLEEKIHLLKGSGMASALGMIEPGEGIPGVVGHIVPTPRLGLPRINLSDGPAGLRIEPIREGEERTFYTTAFPIGTMLACTWNEQLINEVGQAMSRRVNFCLPMFSGTSGDLKGWSCPIGLAVKML